MFPRSMLHRDEILQSTACGCFHCRATFPPAEVVEWTDADDNGVGQTAVCPRCGIDAVVGSASGCPITDALLAEMRRRSFG